ncbi:hypothetical protein [Pseudomonas antarctica]|uniref:hypothetical protein n=1 Tax=Pseudomonas antarctica TaxID=219572 RepID=UPI00387AA687
MNQAIQQSQAVLQALRDRVQLSTSEMYVMIGREEPVKVPRFNVVPLGKNLFDVVERSSGVSRGARTGHDGACQYADQLERNADFFDAAKATSRRFGGRMLRWTVGLAAMIGVPMPNPKDAVIADLHRQMDAFFGAGNKAEEIAAGVSGEVGGPIK